MIFTPLRYLLIKHEQKFVWDLVVPSIFLIASILVVALLRIDIDFTGPSGLFSSVNGLLGVLSGFYIASLAAISTMNGPGLDQEMKGDPPTLKVKNKKKKYTVKLTRRAYLRYLFGYLATIGIALFFYGILMNVFYAPVRESLAIGDHLMSFFSAVFGMIYVFFLANLTMNTLVGIYYLTDRIHRQ